MRYIDNESLCVGAHISLERVCFRIMHSVTMPWFSVQQQKPQTSIFCTFFHISFYYFSLSFSIPFIPQPLDIKVIRHNGIHTRMHKSVQIPKQAAHELQKREVDYFSLMPFVWRKRCWLTAELLDPTQPGFNADAWLMRSTTGIIIRQGILDFSCVSQAGKTSRCCNGNVGFSASV